MIRGSTSSRTIAKNFILAPSTCEPTDNTVPRSPGVPIRRVSGPITPCHNFALKGKMPGTVLCLSPCDEPVVPSGGLFRLPSLHLMAARLCVFFRGRGASLILQVFRLVPPSLSPSVLVATAISESRCHPHHRIPF